MASPTLARIIAGCYEEMIVCYDVIPVEDETEDTEGLTHEENGQSEKAEQTETLIAPKKLKLKLSFTDHPHSGSVRCIAASKGREGTHEIRVRFHKLVESELPRRFTQPSI